MDTDTTTDPSARVQGRYSDQDARAFVDGGDSTAGYNADQRRIAREKARDALAALPESIRTFAVAQADALLALGKDGELKENEAQLQRWSQFMTTVGDAIRQNARVERSIEEQKASFSGLFSIIGTIAKALGFNEFADGCTQLAQDLHPRPIMPDMDTFNQMVTDLQVAFPDSANAIGQAAAAGQSAIQGSSADISQAANTAIAGTAALPPITAPTRAAATPGGGSGGSPPSTNTPAPSGGRTVSFTRDELTRTITEANTALNGAITVEQGRTIGTLYREAAGSDRTINSQSEHNAFVQSMTSSNLPVAHRNEITRRADDMAFEPR
jgi:hypothetical protein